MSLIDRKVNDWSQAVSSLDDKPKMTAAALKAAFDSNSNQLKPAINGIIDDLTGSQGALNIGLTPIDGLSGSNVQSVLQAISLLIKSNDVDLESLERLFTADGASLVGLQPVNGVSGGNLQQAIISLADTISKIDPYLGNPVAISQGGTNSRTSQEAIYKLGCGVRENLFVNPYFKINQRGKLIISNAYSYFVDFWKNGRNGSVLTLQNDYISLNGLGDIFQYLDKDLYGQKLCFSVLTTDGLFYGVINMFKEKPSENKFITVFQNEKISLALGVLKNGLFQASIISQNNTTNNLFAAKLEKGENQTLAYKVADGEGYKGTGWQLFETHNQAKELAECQRYLFSVFRKDGNQGYIGPLQSNGENYALGMLYTPTTMRILPTIFCSDISKISHWHPTYASRLLSITPVGISNAGIQVKVDFERAIPAGYAGYIYSNVPSDDLLVVSAEL